MYDTNNIRQLQQDDNDGEDWNYDVAYGIRVDRKRDEVIPPELIQSEVTVNGLTQAMAAVRNSHSNSDDDGWGELNETTGQRRNNRNNHFSYSNNQNRAPAQFDESAYLAENDQEGIYQDMMNEAIMQSLLESTQNQGSPEMNQQDEEEKILKEVMKMSSLEYQKQNGKIDLSHIKKGKKKKEMEELNDQAL